MQGMDAKNVKTYKEAEQFLNDVPKFTKKNAFEQTQAFYQYLQAEQTGAVCKEKDLGHVIHVAGTNGKGSVCAFLSQICKESQLKTGFFLSPHLITTRERFQINGEMVSEAQFMEAFYLLEERIRSYQETGVTYQPTYFERLFFMMMLIFSKEQLDVTVIETGLGGRLDTTNVIAHPTLTVITEIGFDHMAYLGHTISEIAREKAGIIKPQVPVVFADRKKEATVEIEQRARKQNAPCYKVSKNAYKIKEIQKKSIDFLVCSRYYDYIDLTLKTSAIYQVENAAIAVYAIEEFQKITGCAAITPKTIQAGIAHMFWPGRMQEILPDVYIDGAHNQDGIEAFVQTVEQMFQEQTQKKAILLFSAVSDKKYDDMIKMLAKLSVIKEFIVTTIPGSRGVDIQELSHIFHKYSEKQVHSFERLQDAFSYALVQKGEEDVIFVVGSLYLAGLVEELVADHKHANQPSTICEKGEGK